MRTLTLLAFLVVIHINVYTIDNPTKITGETTRWELFTSTNSKLPHNIVNALHVDNLNNVWIGTQNGVAIAKDTIMKVLHLADGLAAVEISCIFVDETNWAWIGTSTKGITKYKAGQPCVYYSTTTTPATQGNYITQIAEYSITNFWFGTQDKGLHQLQGSTINFFNQNNSPLPTNWITSVQISANGTRWFGTQYDGLWKRDNTKFTQYNTDTSKLKLPNNTVRCLYIDAADKIYIGTDGGFVIYDLPKWTVYSKATTNNALVSNRIYCILPDYGDNLWIGTDAGLVRYDGTDWHTYTATNTKGGLPVNSINCIAQDDSMYIWVGTNSGLSKLKQRAFNICTKSTICAGENTSFYIKRSSSLTSTYKWQVNLGGGWSNISEAGIYTGTTTNRLNLTAVGAEMDSAQYRCVVTFGSLGTDTSNAITLTVNESPPKPFVNIVDSQLITGPAWAYQWYYLNGNIPIPGATTQGHTPGLSTYYYVEVSNSVGCKSKSDPVFAEGNAIAGQKIILSVYPNPSAGIIIVNGNIGPDVINEIVVTNSEGRIVVKKKGINWSGNFTGEINLGDVPEGIYYLKAYSKAGAATYKVTVVK